MHPMADHIVAWRYLGEFHSVEGSHPKITDGLFVYFEYFSVMKLECTVSLYMLNYVLKILHR